MTEIRPNIKQQEAIDNLNGQIMLLAGPGTGKTFTIIHRIEKMLSEGIEPSSILCLTFSDAAANEMKQRLIKKWEFLRLLSISTPITHFVMILLNFIHHSFLLELESD